MKTKTLLLCMALCSVVISGCNAPGKSIGDKRQSVLDMEQEALKDFYKQQPHIKKEVQMYPGYAVLSNGNINIIFASMGSGYGLVRNRQTNKVTYMKMGTGGVGLGLGAKDFRVLIIFKNEKAMEYFIEKGWEFGGHADAAAKASDKGGELSGQGNISSDMITYTITESGLALQATLTGTKYWKYKDLN